MKVLKDISEYLTDFKPVENIDIKAALKLSKATLTKNIKPFSSKEKKYCF